MSDRNLLDGHEEPFSFTEEPARDDRKRYTTQLHRRAQAHITAELGGATVVPDIDRQVTMVVQHAQEATGARRVTFFRPVTRGRRWHVATMLGDGSFYYGLASPESLGWSRQSFEQRRPILFDNDSHAPLSGPALSDIGLRSYLGVPVLSGGRPVAVLEAVDVNQTGELEYYSSQMEESASVLAQRLDDHSNDVEEHTHSAGSSQLELTGESIVDLVLRQPYELDETFEISPTEWTVLNGANGERKIKALAELVSMPISQVVAVSTALIERGLLRVGKENRRRL